MFYNKIQYHDHLIISNLYIHLFYIKNMLQIINVYNCSNIYNIYF